LKADPAENKHHWELQLGWCY